MARYENEKWPRPDSDSDRDAMVFDDDSPVGGGGKGSGCGGAGSGHAVIPNPERTPRPIGTPVIQRSKFHHHEHGTAGSETDVERGRMITDNKGFGCVPKPRAGSLMLAIMEPEPLMSGRDPYFRLSYGNYTMQKHLRDEDIDYCTDDKTGVTTVMDISRQKAESLCRENGLKSLLYIEVGENRDRFHTHDVPEIDA